MRSVSCSLENQYNTIVWSNVRAEQERVMCWGVIIPGLNSNVDNLILYVFQRSARLMEYVKKGNCILLYLPKCSFVVVTELEIVGKQSEYSE